MKEQEIVVDEYEFYRDGNGKIKYYPKCMHCKKSCKQSYKFKSLYCNEYEDRRKMDQRGIS